MKESLNAPIFDTPTRFLEKIGAIHDGYRSTRNDQHKARIYEIIVGGQGESRRELAVRLGLRTSTVSKLVNELIEDSLVYESDGYYPGKGRPGRPLFPQRNRFSIVGIYCISMEFRAVLMNVGEEVIAESFVHVDSSASNEQVMDSVLRLVEEVRDSTPSDSEVVGISLTLPGVVDTQGKRWRYAARWNQLRDLQFEELEKTSGLPCYVSRAIDAELSYLMAKEPAFKKGNTILFHWGYGIGAGFSTNGKVIRPETGVFGQIGHVQVHSSANRLCLCGQEGCLETEAALWALLPEIRNAYPDAPEQEHRFAEYLSNAPSIAQLSSCQGAVRAIADAIRILLFILVPKHVLVYGPFTSDPAIFADITKIATTNAPHFLDEVRFSALQNGFLGSVYGDTSRVFQDILKGYLKSSNTTGE